MNSHQIQPLRAVAPATVMESPCLFSTHPLPRKSLPPRSRIALGQKAKKAIVRSVELYNAKNRKPGQHHGPITPAFQRVLIAMLWKFHNSRTGYCFPSYETIAAAARCCRDTVYEAIKALEAADILTWVNRFDKIRTQCLGVFGRAFTRWQVIRTSNAYCFRDPLPCATEYGSYKSENPPGTLNQEDSYTKGSMKIVVLDPASSLDRRPDRSRKGVRGDSGAPAA